jgi:hypothetical protein
MCASHGPGGARKLALQIHEGVDELGCFDCPIAASDCDLRQDASGDETRDGFVHGLLASADKRRRSGP